eukprot:GHVH01000568.1.p1 GENE.GHVH01000568.1~~GHVH01000568.1.p1  ORF type:complete len:381 (+),score=51.89 GHVH01000568.1:159-1301(+)
MEVAIKAISILARPDYDIKKLDVIADRNIIRRLFKLVTYTPKEFSATPVCGFVKKWFPDRGFGFITSDIGEVYFSAYDVFMNPDGEMESADIDAGSLVKFDLQSKNSRETAVNVRKRDDSPFQCKSSENQVGVVLTQCGTLIFRRLESCLSTGVGYGHSFEHEVGRYPKDCVDGLNGYFQVHALEMGDLKMAIRCETDCMVTAKPIHRSDLKLANHETLRSECLDDYRAAACDGVSGIGNLAIHQPCGNRESMMNELNGMESAELKCLSVNNPGNAQQYYVQLSIGSTDKIVLVRHNRGAISKPPTIRNRLEYAQDEEVDKPAVEAAFGKVAGILKAVREALKGEYDRPYVLKLDTYHGSGSLVPGAHLPVCTKTLKTFC